MSAHPTVFVKGERWKVPWKVKGPLKGERSLENFLLMELLVEHKTLIFCTFKYILHGVCSSSFYIAKYLLTLYLNKNKANLDLILKGYRLLEETYKLWRGSNQGKIKNINLTAKFRILILLMQWFSLNIKYFLKF